MPKKNSPQTKMKFKWTKSSLFLCDSNSQKERIGDYIKVTAFGIDPASNLWLAQIKFKDCDGKRVSILVPRSELKKSGKMKDQILDLGYNFPDDHKLGKYVMAYLATANSKKRITISERTGWAEGQYIFPETVIGPEQNKIVYNPDIETADHNKDATYGSLKDWQDGVASNSMHSTRMSFAICSSFSSSIISMTDIESGGFNFVGPSSIGKTTTLKAALSVFERAGQGDLLTWDITSTALDETAVKHCDRCLVIDETSRASGDDSKVAKVIRDAAYRLASGKGRTRSIHFKDKGNPTQWHISFLSSSENSLSDLAQKSGNQRQKGEEVRLIDIPAIASQKNGVYETVPKEYSPAELSEEIEAACGKYYGVAGRKYVQRLVEDYDECKARIQEYVDNFLNLAEIPQTGWEHRFAKRFALAYAAGKLAIEFQILPWSEKIVKDACLECHQVAREAIPDYELLLSASFSNLRQKLSKRKLFRDLRSEKAKDGDPTDKKVCGFIKEDKSNGVFYAVKPKFFRKWCKDVSHRAVSKKLEFHGHLITSAGKPTKQVLISGIKGKRRYYCIKKSLLED